MLILPAVDLYGGKVVRLKRGNYSEMTVYSDDPLAFAQNFLKQGAKYLHLVDLEGAKTGEATAADTVKSILKLGIKCEIGGGIRNMQTVADYVKAGADKVILGTAAVNDAAFLREAIELFPGKIAAGVDARENKVAINGWEQTTEIDSLDFVAALSDMGVTRIIYTDISKDGMKGGCNEEVYFKLASKYDVQIVASGGVSSVDDVMRLKKAGVYGAIIGRAMYDGLISYEDAAEAAERE